MKKLFVIAAAAAVLGFAAPASAQYSGQYGYQGQYSGGYAGGSDWNTGRAAHSRFEQQYRHTIQGIRHGLNDGTYSRRQANNFYRELEEIRRDAAQSYRYGNYRDGYTQARMARLHERMHMRHDRNHERNDAYGSRGRGNYSSGYDGYRQDHGDDDRHLHDD